MIGSYLERFAWRILTGHETPDFDPDDPAPPNESPEKRHQREVKRGETSDDWEKWLRESAEWIEKVRKGGR